MHDEHFMAGNFTVGGLNFTGGSLKLKAYKLIAEGINLKKEG